MKHTKEKSYSHDRPMVYCHTSLSGMMSELLEPITRNVENISKDCDQSETDLSLQAASLASQFPSQEKGKDLQERNLDCGLKCEGLLGRYDRDTCSWRTLQCLLFEDSTELVQTLPKWGMTCDGELWELTTPTLPTNENDFGFGEGQKIGSKGRHIPTPGTTGLSNGSGNCEKSKQLLQDGVISEEECRSFRAGNGGQLNPYWVEWLMGWPIGWTSLKPLDKEVFKIWKSTSPQKWWATDPADVGQIPRVTTDNEHRKQRLICLGNGQVPACVVLSTEILTQEMKKWNE